MIYNAENDLGLRNGTYFDVAILTVGNPAMLMNGLERISAQHITNSQLDGDVYELELTPSVRNLTPGFESYQEFKGQSGMYAVTIERPRRPGSLPSPFTCYTDPIADGLIPLPVPKNLEVSFKSGATTPTLSFDPVGGFPTDSSEWYNIRIYDKNYSRRIYAVTIGTGWCGSSNGNLTACSIVGSNPSVTYDDYRSVTSQTFEDLVPGEEYIFRADLMKELPYPFGSTVCSSPQCNIIQSSHFKTFKVPKQ